LPADSDLSSVRRKTTCDLYYVRRISLWLDVQIMVATCFYLLALPFAISRWLVGVPALESMDPLPTSMPCGELNNTQLQPA
jgi:hypothetical protein